MTFGEALEGLKRGERCFRGGWNGKDMFLLLVPLEFARNACPVELVPLPWIGMRTADGGFVPWLASQTDLLADDWRFAA